MKRGRRVALASAILLLLALSSAQAASDPKRFPMERLEEARRALDAARGDAAAVTAWLAEGKDPDAQGDFELTSVIDSADLPQLFRGLTGGPVPPLEDAVFFEATAGRYLLLRMNTGMAATMNALGLGEGFRAWATDKRALEGTTWQFTDTVDLLFGKDVVTLRTPIGRFVFKTRPADPSGWWTLDGTEPLTGWTVQGVGLKVRFFDDGRLTVLAAALEKGSDEVSLIVSGIPSFNPLECAIVYGRVEVIKALLAAGASPTVRTSTGETALHAAARWGKKDSVQALLDAGQDINARMLGGITPLMVATEGPTTPPAVFRVGSGPNAKVWALDAVSAQLSAVREVLPRASADNATKRSAREEVALSLLTLGADASLTRDNGENVLFDASRLGMLALVNRLLDAGLEPDEVDARGESAVFAAVRANAFEALKLLISRGASWRSRNTEGKMPLAVAIKLRSWDCVGILRYLEPLHVSVAPSANFSWASLDGYDVAWGRGAALDVQVRLPLSLWLTAEAGYTVRSLVADTADPLLVSTEGDPYFEYANVDIACLLEYAFPLVNVMRLTLVAGAAYLLETSAFLRTDSGLWDAIDLGGPLTTSGPAVILGVGWNGFWANGLYTGIEMRWLRALGDEWTGRGAGLGSASFLFRIGI
jgi:ankyrin repeat protein